MPKNDEESKAGAEKGPSEEGSIKFKKTVNTKEYIQNKIDESYKQGATLHKKVFERCAGAPGPKGAGDRNQDPRAGSISRIPAMQDWDDPRESLIGMIFEKLERQLQK